jgi:hypothetical protein
MPRKDDVRSVAQDHVAADVDSLGQQRVDFFDDRGRVDHDAGGDDVQHTRSENAAGDVVQLVGLVADDHRVAGVGPALIADDDVEA